MRGCTKFCCAICFFFLFRWCVVVVFKIDGESAGYEGIFVDRLGFVEFAFVA